MRKATLLVFVALVISAVLVGCSTSTVEKAKKQAIERLALTNSRDCKFEFSTLYESDSCVMLHIMKYYKEPDGTPQTQAIEYDYVIYDGGGIKERVDYAPWITSRFVRGDSQYQGEGGVPSYGIGNGCFEKINTAYNKLVERETIRSKCGSFSIVSRDEFFLASARSELVECGNWIKIMK